MERRWKRVALLTAGILMGVVMVGTPVGAHVTSSVNHIWAHIKPKADNRYVNVGESLWAVVNSNATLARGGGVAAINDIGTGITQVYFRRNITNCATTATIGLAGNSGIESAGFITIVGTAGDGPGGIPNERGVFVNTYDTSGSGADRGFTLKVDCAKFPSLEPEIGPALGASAHRGQNRR